MSIQLSFVKYLLIGFVFVFNYPVYSAENYSAEKTQDIFLVGDFSTQPSADLPKYWQALEFDAVKKHTKYHYVEDKDGGAIHASSEASSSGLVRKLSLDMEKMPILTWQWKIQSIIKSADLSIKEGDDAPARVYVTFAYDSKKVKWWESVKFEAIKLVYGEYPPINAIIYVWASHLEKGTEQLSPYTDRVQVVALQSGQEKAGQWQTQRRNVYKDYQRLFPGQKIPKISGIAIMTDTDNTQSKAQAWYKNIKFLGSKK